MRKRVRIWFPSVLYRYVRTRMLEGTMSKGPSQGCFLLSSMRVAVGWGIVSEYRWPFNGKRWPLLPKDIYSLDIIAKFNRFEYYFAVRNIDDARICIASKHAFMTSVAITKQWYKAPRGVIDLPLGAAVKFLGNHAFEIVGYDDTTRQFCFRNSWGSQWGDNGYGYLPYSYFSLYMSEGWCEICIRPKKSIQKIRDKTIFLTECVNPLGNYSTIISLFDSTTNTKVGWCFITFRDGYADVEDFFVKPDTDVVKSALSIGSLMVARIKSAGLPIRFWLSHCDDQLSYNQEVVNNVIDGLGLGRMKSPQRWAAIVAR